MKRFTKKQYTKFCIAAVLYGLFILWMQNGWLTLGYILIADIFDALHSLGGLEAFQEPDDT